MENKMNIRFSPPDVGEAEIEEVIDAIKSGWITTGPKTKLFEQKITELCKTEKTVCLNSSTAAMEMTLRVLGVGPGDEVITSAYTYTASCSVICHVGATPVLVDIQKDNFEMDYDKLEQAITEKTKVIIPVDIGGVMCDYDRIQKIVEKKANIFKPSSELQKKLGRIAIMADSSHAIGAMRNGKMAGEYADFTCFSFHAVKNLTTAEGGAVTWKKNDKFDNEAIYKRYQLLSLHGQTKDALHKNQLGAWEYDIVERRHEIIKIYEDALKGHQVKTLNHEDEKTNSKSSGHLFITRVEGIDEKTRNEIIIKMAERGIATNVHYKPLPMLTAYKNLGFDIKNYPNAFDYYKCEITLPLYSLLTDEEAKYVITNFVDILKEYGK